MKKIDADELNSLLTRLKVTESGIEIVHKLRIGESLGPKPQVRHLRKRGRQVSTRMGFTVCCNDAALQFALLHELDCPNSDCVEFYSWPMDIGGVRYSVANGTRVEVDVFRPFLLTISETWCGFVDAFPTSMLRERVSRGSGLYEESSPGQWVSEPISEWLCRYGLGYQILTEAHLLATRG
ncbi:hypothetical protein P3T18_002978 [Paraburkholderia sp. GAS199]